jgi:hypothetical protein
MIKNPIIKILLTYAIQQQQNNKERKQQRANKQITFRHQTLPPKVDHELQGRRMRFLVVVAAG